MSVFSGLWRLFCEKRFATYIFPISVSILRGVVSPLRGRGIQGNERECYENIMELIRPVECRGIPGKCKGVRAMCQQYAGKYRGIPG